MMSRAAYPRAQGNRLALTGEAVFFLLNILAIFTKIVHN
jgi:hypothetical protein